uniref:hypothetical protein n=1 Tax=Prevotella sp. TaxID=59823 RepID=UPI004025096F
MILNSLLKNTRLMCLAGFLGSSMPQMNAAPIEHIGDRYIMHVSEMELTGEESLLDVLMMCPEVISLDGNNIIGGDPFANQYGKFVIRIDNQEYGLDYATLLHHFKAREIESIKVCQNAEVMKGCSSLKKVIDITLRKGENGVSGRVGLFGDTYGGGKGIVSVLSQQDDLRILSHVEGNFQRTSNSDKDAYQNQSSNTINHYSHEGAKLNVLWTPTSKDILEVDAMQTYTRNHFTHSPAEYVRAYHLQADYTRTLGENGSSILFTLGAEHISDNGRTQEESQTFPYQNHSTYPFAVVEYATPVLTQDLWITAGFEGGLSIEKNCIADYINHSNYEDFYVQLDYNIGKWGFMAGERYRIINFRPKQISSVSNWKHTTRNHIYSFSTYYTFTPGHTLQGTFCRRIFNPEFGDFVTAGDMEGAWKPTYTTNIRNSLANVMELKYTYSKPNLVVSTSVKNIHQHLIDNNHDNTLGIGTTAFWHTGILRLTAGFNYFWERAETPVEETSLRDTSYHNFAVFKLAPQLTLPDGWRLTSNLIWCTYRHTATPAYTPANLYAEVGLYKNIGKHLTLEGRFHDIASQHFGNRAATIGCTYYF